MLHSTLLDKHVYLTRFKVGHPMITRGTMWARKSWTSLCHVRGLCVIAIPALGDANDAVRWLASLRAVENVGLKSIFALFCLGTSLLVACHPLATFS